MKFYSLIFWLLIIGISFQANSQDINETLLENANTLILNSEKQFTIKSPKSAVYNVVESRMILNSKSSFNRLLIFYNQFIKIKEIHGTITGLNGKVIRRIGKSEIQDYSATGGSIYADNRVKLIEVEHNSYPYIITFEYTTEHSGIRDYPNWNPQPAFNTSVKHASFTVTVPKETNLRYKQINTDITPNESSDSRIKTYNWEISDLGPVQAEPYCPNEFDYLPNVLIAPDNFEIDGHKGNMSTWKSYGDFFHTLNENGGTVSSELSNKIEQLTSHLPTKKGKIDALYKYMQDNTRYVSVQLGIGGWKSFPVQYVEDNKFGDCKALTYFMRAMLDEIDITAYPALIYSDASAKSHFDDFTEPAFNHVILYVPNEEIWLECTSNEHPINYLGSSNENRKALVVQQGNSKLVNTPAPTPEQNKQAQKIKVDLSADGSAIVALDRLSTGIQHDRMLYLKNEPKEDQEDWIYENIELPDFELNTYQVSSNPDKAQGNFSFEAAVSKLASVSGKRLFVYPNILNRTQRVPKKMEERRFPIYRQNAWLDEDIVTIAIPEGYTIESQPENLKLDTDFGRFSIEITVTGNQLMYKRVYESFAFQLPAERYSDLRTFYKQIARSDKGKLVLVKP